MDERDLKTLFRRLRTPFRLRWGCEAALFALGTTCALYALSMRLHTGAFLALPGLAAIFASSLALGLRLSPHGRRRERIAVDGAFDAGGALCAVLELVERRSDRAPLEELAVRSWGRRLATAVAAGEGPRFAVRRGYPIYLALAVLGLAAALWEGTAGERRARLPGDSGGGASRARALSIREGREGDREATSSPEEAVLAARRSLQSGEIDSERFGEELRRAARRWKAELTRGEGEATGEGWEGESGAGKGERPGAAGSGGEKTTGEASAHAQPDAGGALAVDLPEPYRTVVARYSSQDLAGGR